MHQGVVKRSCNHPRSRQAVEVRKFLWAPIPPPSTHTHTRARAHTHKHYSEIPPLQYYPSRQALTPRTLVKSGRSCSCVSSLARCTYVVTLVETYGYTRVHVCDVHMEKQGCIPSAGKHSAGVKRELRTTRSSKGHVSAHSLRVCLAHKGDNQELAFVTRCVCVRVRACMHACAGVRACMRVRGWGVVEGYLIPHLANPWRIGGLHIFPLREPVRSFHVEVARLEEVLVLLKLHGTLHQLNPNYVARTHGAQTNTKRRVRRDAKRQVRTWECENTRWCAVVDFSSTQVWALRVLHCHGVRCTAVHVGRKGMGRTYL